MTYAACMQAHILFEYGKGWHESQGASVSNGTFRY